LMSIGTTYVTDLTDEDLKREKKGNTICCGAILVIIVAATIGVEVYFRMQLSAIREITNSARTAYGPEYINVGKNIFTTSEPTVIPDIKDSYFNVEGSGFLMKRSVEYCQWVEHVSTKYLKDQKKKVQTYWYTKEWVNHLIPSIFFNDAITHMNPSRNPVSTETFYPEFPVPLKNGFSLPKDVLSYLQAPDESVLLGHRELRRYTMSKAFNTDEFKYIGDGWFYSSYKPSYLESFFQMANFQVYDLFAKCQAGDIRVRFTTKKANSVSLIAKQDTENGILAPIQTSNGINKALLVAGTMSKTRLEQVAIDSYFWSVWINRVIGFLALIGSVAFFVSVSKKIEIKEKEVKKEETSTDAKAKVE